MSFYQTIPHFINLDTDWMFQQPARENVKRICKFWEGEKSVIAYCDDRFPVGETRRRVLWVKGMEEYPQDLTSFLLYSHASHVDYVDVFTTSRWLDQQLQKVGFVPLKEKPVVWKSKQYKIKETVMQGIDRENWLYLAAAV